MSEISVRYIVDDIDSSVTFYTAHLGFEERMRPGPGFAMLLRGDLRLLLNVPGGPGGAGQPTSEGVLPEPGGWNRFQIEVENLGDTLDQLRRAEVRLRSDVIEGRGGRQALVEDPSGNLVELFEPAAH